MQQNNNVISLYIVKREDGNYFAGYDANKKVAMTVSSPLEAKKFTNKYDIKLRPNEKLVEMSWDLSKVAEFAKLSEPFRPHRKKVEAY
jgi:hypothetical protein